MMNTVNVNIPYQEKHSRWSVLFRPLLAIPIIVVMLLMIVPNMGLDVTRSADVYETVTQGQVVNTREHMDFISAAQAANQYMMDRVNMHSVGDVEVMGFNIPLHDITTYSILFVGYLLLIPLASFTLWLFYIVNIATAVTLLFRKKYPSWWYVWNQELQSFVLRIYCYSLFLTDRYPSLESQDSQIKLDLPDPKAQNLNRVLPLVKWLLVLPYLAIYLIFLAVALVMVPVTFLMILLTGKLPRWIYRYQVSVIKFYLRIAAYAILLVTDKYPAIIFKG